MLTNRLPVSKLLFFLLLSTFSFSSVAQPVNDRCDTPTLLALGLDAETCILARGDTRGTEDATTIGDVPLVCSGSWFTDDVWYSFNTGDEVPAFGVTVEVRLDPTSGTELIEHGMAIYQDCDSETSPIDCFTDEEGRRRIEFPATCMEPNSSYLIRLWSAPEPRMNEGTFSICAYETPQDTTGLNEPKPRIIYEETFDEGFNGWESVSLTQSFNINTGEMVDDHWMWSNTGCFTTYFGTNACISPEGPTCEDQAVIGIPVGFYQGEWGCSPNCGLSSPPYPNKHSYVISPAIDLSNESCVSLTWDESARFLEGESTLSVLGSYVQYSLDNGKTWNNPSKAIGTADVSVNYGGAYESNAPSNNNLKRSIPLIGAEGNSSVRIRFGFDGTFYFWIVDNIRIVESTTVDAVVQQNAFTRATINPMSIHMIDSYDFVLDFENLACEELTKVNANMTITNSNNEVVHNVDLDLGTIKADTIVRDQSFLQAFTPPTIIDNYTNTYTISSDRDDDLSNNFQTFQTSVVDEMVFRKENGIANSYFTPFVDPGSIDYENPVWQWEMGNIFFAPNSTAITDEALKFNEISFQLINPAAIKDDTLTIWLYEISDNNFDNMLSKDDNSEITRLGISEYIVTGVEKGLITAQLTSYDGNEESLYIKSNTHYMAAVETTTEVERLVAMTIAADDSYDYSKALSNTRQTAMASGDLSQVRYSFAFSIAEENHFRIGPGYSDDLIFGNFPDDATPIIRLGYEIANSVSTLEIYQDIKINISPNPTASKLTLDLSIDKVTEMEISIVNLTGKTLNSRSIKGVTELTESFDVSALSNGVYMIHVKTKEGVQTKKFVVSKY